MTNERSLVRKLSEVMAAVERVPKKGHNAHFNYDFVRETDLLALVRPEFAKRQLLMTMSADAGGAKQNGNVLTVPFNVVIHDGESGETLEFTVLGAGQDTQDKGPYKALTGAVKYALMKLLLVDTGDDPEDHKDEPKVRAAKAEPKPKAESKDIPEVPAPSMLMSDTGFVTLVTQKKDKENTPPKWTLYSIRVEDGAGATGVYTTFSRTLAEAAKDAEEAAAQVKVTFNKTSRGNELVTIEPAQ